MGSQMTLPPSNGMLDHGVRIRRVPGDRVMASARQGGGFAEEYVGAAEKVHKIPDNMDFATAAGFIIGYGTAYFGLKYRGALQAGETLLVNGAAGGVGLSAIQVGKALGAKVIACASSPEKLALATCAAPIAS